MYFFVVPEKNTCLFVFVCYNILQQGVKRLYFSCSEES